MALEITITPIEDLRPHPRNYRKHPPDQVAHIKQSILEHSIYRPVVCAQDGTILAGHGLVQAARELGIGALPTVFLPLDAKTPAAMKILVGDNQIGATAEMDTASLVKILDEICGDDTSHLLGTGYDVMILRNLAYIAAPPSLAMPGGIQPPPSSRSVLPMPPIDGSSSVWCGVQVEQPPEVCQLIIRFHTVIARDEFCAKIDWLPVRKSSLHTWSAVWPTIVPIDYTAISIAESE